MLSPWLDRIATKALVWLILAAVGFLLVSTLRGCWQQPESRQTQQVAAEYKTVRVVDSTLTDSLKKALSRASGRLSRALRTADSAVRVSDSLRMVPVPQGGDTVAYWRDRALAAERAVDALTRDTLSLKQEALRQMAVTEAVFTQSQASKDSVIAHADQLIASLHADLQAQRCYYIPRIVPCLSRNAERVTIAVVALYGGMKLAH